MKMHSLLVWLLHRLASIVRKSSHALPRACLRVVLNLYNALKRLIPLSSHKKDDHAIERSSTKTLHSDMHFESLPLGSATSTISVTTVCASQVPDTLSAQGFLRADSGSSMSRPNSVSRPATPDPNAISLLPIAHGPVDRGRQQFSENLTTEGYPGYPGHPGSVSSPNVGWSSRWRSLSRPNSPRLSVRTNSPLPGNRSSAAVSVHSHMSRRSHLSNVSHLSRRSHLTNASHVTHVSDACCQISAPCAFLHIVLNRTCWVGSGAQVH